MNKKFLNKALSVALSFLLVGTTFGISQIKNIQFANASDQVIMTTSDATNTASESEVLTVATTTETENAVTTDIYFTNDVHGYITNVVTNGLSYATVAALKASSTAAGNTAICVDAGDHASGSAIANYDSGEGIMDIINGIYDFRVPGNHEFDYGSTKFLEGFAKEAEYYACNFYQGTPDKRGENKLESYKVIEGANNQKIAFIGIMTPETITASAPGYFQDTDGNWVMYIDNATQPVQDSIYTQFNNAINEVKTKYGNDTICIGVGHLGNEKAAVDEGRDSSTVIAKSKGLSAFIDGHSHQIYNTTVKDADGNDVALVQAASGLNSLDESETTGMNRIGKLTISADKKISAQILDSTDLKDVQHDETIANKEIAQIDKVAKALSTVVASSNLETDGSKSTQRAKPNNLADLVMDAFYYYANNVKDDSGVINGADISIANGGSFRSSLDKGEVTLNSCMNVVPFINTINVCEVTGQQILDALEYGAKDSPALFAGLLHVAGLSYTIDTTIPSTVQVANGTWVGGPTGEYRVKDVKVYDKNKKEYVALDLKKTYKCAGSDYLLGNYGDGYAMFKGATKHTYNNILIYKVFAYYLSYFNSATENTDIKASLPIVSTKNSPLRADSTFDNYNINYENPSGANRINIITSPQPDPTPTPEEEGVATSSGATGDNTVNMAIFVMFLITGCGAFEFSRRKIYKNR